MIEIVLGALLLLSPFVAVTWLWVNQEGWRDALIGWGIILLLLIVSGTVLTGIVLISNGLTR